MKCWLSLRDEAAMLGAGELSVLSLSGRAIGCLVWALQRWPVSGVSSETHCIFMTAYLGGLFC